MFFTTFAIFLQFLSGDQSHHRHGYCNHHMKKHCESYFHSIYFKTKLTAWLHMLACTKLHGASLCQCSHTNAETAMICLHHSVGSVYHHIKLTWSSPPSISAAMSSEWSTKFCWTKSCSFCSSSPASESRNHSIRLQTADYYVKKPHAAKEYACNELRPPGTA